MATEQRRQCKLRTLVSTSAHAGHDFRTLDENYIFGCRTATAAKRSRSSSFKGAAVFSN